MLIQSRYPLQIQWYPKSSVPTFNIGVDAAYRSSGVIVELFFYLIPNVELYAGSIVEITAPTEFNLNGAGVTIIGDITTYSSAVV